MEAKRESKCTLNYESAMQRDGAGRVVAVTRRQFVLLFGAALGALALDGCATSSSSTSDGGTANEAKFVTVTDFSGAKVEVPVPVEHIGALLGNSFPQILFLGGASRVAVRMNMTDTAWLKIIDPNFDSYGIEYIDSPREPNIEDLTANQVDVVFYWGGLDEQVKKMNDVGIPVVVSNPSVTQFETVEDWRKLIEEEIMIYATVLGGEAVEKAREWLDYVDEQLAYLKQRTKNLKDDEIKRVYCIRNQDDGLQCFAASSYPKALVQAAGGRLVSGDVDTKGGGFTTVTMEDVIGWDPQYVFMGWMNDTEPILNNEQWAPITAVKNKDVYLTPCSLNSTGWDYCTESPLQILYFAKTIHPDLFEDLDLAEKICEFYSKFYGATLTRDQAAYMMRRLGPDGTSAGSTKL